MFHYSKIHCLKDIIDSGVIKRATVGVPKHEKPAVWLTVNGSWDGTALRDDCMEPYHRNVFLPIKFVLKDEVIESQRFKIVSWEEHKISGGMDSVYAKTLEKTAIESNTNPEDWFCCYDDIPVDCFYAPQVWDGSKWVSIENAERILAEGKEATRRVKHNLQDKEKASLAQKKAKRKAAQKQRVKNRKK